MFLLKDIQQSFEDELNKPGMGKAARTANLSNLEGVLARVVGELAEIKLNRGRGPTVAAPASGPGRVKSLVGFHERQQSDTTALDRYGEQIIRLRLWLHRQGAALTRDGKIVWPKSKARVTYDRELEQVMTTVRIRGGLFFGMDGKPLDTSLMVTAFSGPGSAIFVVSAEGTLHVTSHMVGQRHHSSLLGGTPVACAGELKCAGGRLSRVTNKSGHYMPEPFYLAQVIRHFGEQGVNLGSFGVVAFDKSGRTDFTSASAFLESQEFPIYSAPMPPGGAFSYAGASASGGGRPKGAYAGSDYDLVDNPLYVQPPTWGGGGLKGEYVHEIPGMA